MSRPSVGKALALASALAMLFASGLVAAEEGAIESKPAAIAITGNTKWSLRLPQDARVLYRGVVSYDEAGTGTGSFLYPAPNAGGLLAAVITHALLVDSAKQRQKEKLQATADQVLLPYKAAIDNFNYRELMRRAVEKTANGANASLVEESAELGQALLVESAPIFSLTQDQKAIVMDNVISIQAAGATPEAAYRNTIRVISAARDTVDPIAWTANGGEKLKDESAQLVAKSLEVAFRDAAAEPDPAALAFRTIRYQEGSVEKIERAQVLSKQCDRLLIRTLRGNLMSVPASRATEGCEPSATIAN